MWRMAVEQCRSWFDRDESVDLEVWRTPVAWKSDMLNTDERENKGENTFGRVVKLTWWESSPRCFNRPVRIEHGDTKWTDQNLNALQAYLQS